MSANQEKQALRKQALSARDAITPDYREGKNILIGAQLLQKLNWEELEQQKKMSAWASAPADSSWAADSDDDFGREPETPQITIAVYSPMGSEADIGSVIGMAYMHEACVCFPCMQRIDASDAGEDGSRTLEMILRAVGLDQRGKCPFVADPLQAFDADEAALADYPVVAPGDIDVVIVPLVAFDAAGNRLGYGGGNYDRFLAQVRRDARVIGVAYEEQRVDHVPTEPFDYPLPVIVSA